MTTFATALDGGVRLVLCGGAVFLPRQCVFAQEDGQTEEQLISRGFTVFVPGTFLASKWCPGM